MTVELRAEPSDLPEARTAIVDFLVVGSGPSFGKVESSISLVRDGSALMVIDPGMVSDRRKILDPLEKLSVDPKDVTDILLSHHHPDYTLNAAVSKCPGPRRLGDLPQRHLDLACCRGCSADPVGPPHRHPRSFSRGHMTATEPVALLRASDTRTTSRLRKSRGAFTRILRVADHIVPRHGPAFTPGMHRAGNWAEW